MGVCVHLSQSLWRAGSNNAEVTSKYDLVANVCHDGKAGEGNYRVHIHRKKEELWCASPLCWP